MNIWNPLRELELMQDRMMRAINLGTPRRGEDNRQSLTTAEWAPAVDIVEKPDEYLIKAELPEVAKDDVQLTIEKGVLTLKGERRLEREENDTTYHRLERSYGSFLRSFSVPEDTDSEKVAAEFKDGILQVHLPKCETKKPKQIEVKAN